MDQHSDLIVALALAGRRAARAGLVVGSGGNLSARLPGADRCVITAAGAWLDTVDTDTCSIIDLDGAVMAGSPEPSSEWQLHTYAYRARPDVGAIIHLHPQASVLLDALGYPIRLLTTDHAFYVREVRTVPFIPPGTAELAAAAAARLDGCDCLVLAHHGCAVVADSVELAAKRVANLEEAALATYRALLLGDRTTTCPPVDGR